MRRRRGLRSRENRTSGPHKFLRGRVWYGYFGHHDEVSLHTRDESEASQRFAAEIARRQAQGTNRRATPGEKTLDVIAEKYTEAAHGWTRRTQQTTENRVIAFTREIEKLGVTYPSHLTRAVLDTWRKARMSKCASPTINRDEDVARGMLRWGREHGLCGRTAIEETKRVREARRKAPPLIPSPREIAVVAGRLRALGEDGAALTVAVAAATGLRIDELRHMGEHWIHPGAIAVTPESGAAADAWQSKGFTERRVPASDAALTLARQFLAWRSGTGGKGRRVGVADTWIAKQIDRACAANTARGWAQVDAFRMHDLRRTFATECVRAGIPLTTVREWLGHVDVTTTERYLGRYRDDATLAPPTPAVLDVFGRETATVVSLTAAKVPPTAARQSQRERRATTKSHGEKRRGRVRNPRPWDYDSTTPLIPRPKTPRVSRSASATVTQLSRLREGKRS